MDIRYAIHPEHAKTLDTAGLRKEFLIEKVFIPGSISLTYSHNDRIIAGGIMPAGQKLALEGSKDLGADSFLERRELGLINIGGPGIVTVDGSDYALGTRDGLYVGKGAKEVAFSSSDENQPAKFYLASAPAHQTYPAQAVSLENAGVVKLGAKEQSNKRIIYQYVHPAILKSCQLVMGMTILEAENVWNTMPTHTHDRRMEVYFYFNLPEKERVFHLFGKPDETRHIVVKNEQAVISPSWSIHSGVGTTHYTFILAMIWENQTFTDMDHVPMEGLR